MESLLYLNKYTAIISQGEEYFFEVNGNFNLTENGYVLDEKQKKQLDEMLSGKGFSEQDYIEIWGENTVKSFVEDHILLPKEQDITSFQSRTEAYFDFEHISNGVERLKEKSVMVLGCGSIGTHVAWNLAAMGIGKLVLVDFDRVEESNINRQLLFDIDDVGKLKTEVLKDKLSKIDLTGKIIAENLRITDEKMLEALCEKYNCDLIVKSADTPEEFPVWLDHVCEKHKMKYVSGTMTGTYFAVGPTYLADGESVGYSKMFSQSADYKIIAGRRPSISIQLSYAGALMSAEACRILLNLKNYQYVNKVTFEEPIQVEKMDMIANGANIEANEEWKHNMSKNALLFSMVLLVFFALTGRNPLFWVGGILILTSSVSMFTLPSRAVEAATVNSIIYFFVGFIITIIDGHLIGPERGVVTSIVTVFYIFIMYSLFILLEATLAFVLSVVKQKVSRHIQKRRESA